MRNTKNLRADAVAKVTGRAIYANDINLPGMLHVKVVRSTLSHANILSIETDAAAAVPGVVAVLTAKDIPGIGNQPKERPVLCGDRVRYIGDGVALVVADTRAAAEEGAKLVNVQYEELPALLDPREALKEGAPRIHEGGNLLCRYKTTRGDVDTALEHAPHVIEREYTTQRVQHASMETEVCVVNYDALSGQTTVQCPINSPFAIRKLISETMGCPQADVRILVATIGGTFGGKNYDTAVACSRAGIASRATGRPCKVVLTREESILEGTKRHPIQANYRVGFDDDGRLLAAKIDVLLDGGAYTSKSHPVTSRMAIEATGPYSVPAVDTTVTNVYTNNVYSDALRGFGSPQVDFCSESMMDEIALYLGKDPIEVRRLNMLADGKTSAFGEVMRDVTLEECLSALEQSAELKKRKKEAEEFNKTSPEIKKGVGIAILHRGEAFGAAGQGVDTASGMLTIQQDGSVIVNSSIADVGQAGPTTMISIVHETLGISRDRIRASRIDTAGVTDAGPTVASRGTVFSGGAIYNAALALKEKLEKYARKRLGERELVFKDDKIFAADDPGECVELRAVVSDAFAACDHLNALGFFTNPPLEYDKKTGVGRAYMSYVYGATAACVSVDTRTGVTSVDDFFAVHDIGHAFDKEEVVGQICGGVSMGVGYAVMEDVEISKGKVQNLNFENYLLPTTMDMPNVHVTALEIPSSYGPLGAKGIGEPATSVVAPAIINAIAHATGKRIRNLPANLERVALDKELKKG
ncbi:MAG: xanthine dehydrogenase family protein molybdopterin-binding subunit [Bacillota bacterium]